MSASSQLQVGLSYLMELAEQEESIAQALPLLLRLRGQPYSLDWSHFMFEPMFRLRGAPRQLLYMTSRQVAKSTNLAASQIILAASTRDFNALTVMPLQEQVRKFSANYVQPFIVTSPLKKLLKGPGDSVFQRSIGSEYHNSRLFYSYSSGDPNRIRGISADAIFADEVQDLDLSDLPVIEACTNASRFKLLRFTGTPKTLDNTINELWEDTSKARWHIPCVCGHLNRCSVDGDLLKMIGEGRFPDGTPRSLICARCGRPANSREGYYIHDAPHLQRTFAGYHVSQPILPMHYESPRDWAIFLEHMRKKPKYQFYNEFLGEPFDTGAKMLTREELANAAKVPARPLREIQFAKYIMTTVGVDFGGRGKEKASDTDDFISNTAISIAGLLPDGRVEIPYIHKIPFSMDPSSEVDMILQAASACSAAYIALDYGGQGNVQEQIIRANGWPADRIIPFTYAYMAPTKPLVFFTRPTDQGVRSSYTLDKARSLMLLVELIKRGPVVLPGGEYLDDHLQDFMNIYLEQIDSPNGSARRLVKRMKRRTDDVVHSVNYAVMGLYHAAQMWPEVTSAFIETRAKSR